MGVLVKAGRNAGSVSVAVFGPQRAPAAARGRPAKYEPLETHTQPTYLFGGATAPQSLRTKRARDRAATPPQDRRRASSRHTLALEGNAFDSGAAACGRTRSPQALGGRAAGGSRTLPHALLAVGVRVALPAAQTHCIRAPGAAGGVVCTVGRRARWRAPRKGTQNKSLDAAVA
jgi:hypothetical protein